MSEDVLEVAVAELRPSLEALLMVADQPLDETTLASAVGHPVAEVVGGAGRARRGVRRAGPRLRAAQRRRRLALLHPRGVRRRRRGASCSTASRPGSPRRPWRRSRWLPTSSPSRGPGSRRSGGQRRRRDADAAHPRAGRGGRARTTSSGAHLYRTTQLLPGADRGHLARRAARAGALPARHGRPRRRRRVRERDDRGARPIDEEPATTTAWSGCRSCWRSRASRRRRMRGADARRLVEVDGEIVTRLGTKVDPTHRRDPGRGQAAAADLRRMSTSRSTSRAASSRRCPTPQGRPTLHRPRRRPARAALPRRPARHRHRRPDPAHQRRRLRPPPGPPVVRGGQDLRRRGRRPGRPRDVRRLLEGVTLDDGPVTVSQARIVERRSRTSRSSSW